MLRHGRHGNGRDCSERPFGSGGHLPLGRLDQARLGSEPAALSQVRRPDAHHRLHRPREISGLRDLIPGAFHVVRDLGTLRTLGKASRVRARPADTSAGTGGTALRSRSRLPARAGRTVMSWVGRTMAIHVLEIARGIFALAQRRPQPTMPSKPPMSMAQTGAALTGGKNQNSYRTL